MPKIRVNDISLHYEILGQNNADNGTVMFVSGFSADHSNWLSVAPLIAQKHRVVLFDNRGVGRSDAPNYLYHIDMMIDDTAQLIQELNLGKVHLVGNSMGGIIVQGVASKYANLVATSVVSNSFYNPQDHGRLKVIIESNLKLHQDNIQHSALITMLTAGLYSNDFLSDQNNFAQLMQRVINNPHPVTKETYLNQANALLNSDTSSWLQNINCPTMVVHSDEDFWSDAQQAKYLHSNIKNAKIHCFNGVGHIPHIEKPLEFSQLVMDFIATHSTDL